MSHDCRRTLCETPHSDLDSHPGECGCAACHESHDWSEWNVYPECEGCLSDMALWIHESTDFEGCPIPEVCEYSRACDIQWRNRFQKPGLVA